MYAQVEKSKESKSRAIANSVAQKNKNQGIWIVDNRPESIAQAKLKALAPKTVTSTYSAFLIQRSTGDKQAEDEMSKAMGSGTEAKAASSSTADTTELRERLTAFFDQLNIGRVLLRGRRDTNEGVQVAKSMLDEVGIDAFDALLDYIESNQVEDFFNVEVSRDDEVIALNACVELLGDYISRQVDGPAEEEAVDSSEMELYEQIPEIPAHLNELGAWPNGKKVPLNQLKTADKSITKRVGDMIREIYAKYPDEFDEHHPGYFKIVQGLIKMCNDVLEYIGKQDPDSAEVKELASNGIIAGLLNMMRPNHMGIHCHAILLSQMIGKF